MPMQRHALARLLDDARTPDRLGSYAGIARAAAGSGYKISKQRLQQLADETPLSSIMPQNMRAISAALEIPIDRVIDAALDATGLRPLHDES